MPKFDWKKASFRIPARSPQYRKIHRDVELAITVQPTDAIVATGEDAVFTIDAEGDAPITYQWFEYTFEV